MNALSANGLSYSYGTKQVLRDVTFELSSGTCTMVVGPNGAGKTTLFSLITGLLAKQLGQIALPQGGMAKMGIVFQQSALDIDLTVRQNLCYYCGLHGLSRDAAAQKIDEITRRLDLQDRLNHKLRTLNGGHKRRVEIARALLNQPDLLLLDEPTTGLDIPTRNKLVSDLHALASETNLAILWATHLVDEVWSNDLVIILSRGKIVSDGSVQNVLQQSRTKSIAEAFAVLTMGEAA